MTVTIWSININFFHEFESCHFHIFSRRREVVDDRLDVIGRYIHKNTLASCIFLYLANCLFIHH